MELVERIELFPAPSCSRCLSWVAVPGRRAGGALEVGACGPGEDPVVIGAPQRRLLDAEAGRPRPAADELGRRRPPALARDEGPLVALEEAAVRECEGSQDTLR